ncbi:XdhC family protein [Pannonibacter sp.]|uniref:XdhC family protein n=1 Tax=Pannonibacter sp. TaxID=1906786 RepID=UPI003F72F2A3
MDRLRREGAPYALATVVRTVSVTAAKAGAKAVIAPDGTMLAGWIGGGCARGAVLKAAREALADGQPRLISVQPEDLLAEQGVAAGDERQGVRYARSMCPSKGTMDVFVEPVLPRPRLVVLGASPVAVALADLGPRLGFDLTVCALPEDQPVFASADERIEGYALPVESPAARYVVVATQGRGDLVALKAALAVEAEHVAFVGSRKKAEALSQKLQGDGIGLNQIGRMKAPAGLDLGAITPEEIALSVLAEIIVLRRKGQRDTPELAKIP